MRPLWEFSEAELLRMLDAEHKAQYEEETDDEPLAILDRPRDDWSDLSSRLALAKALLRATERAESGLSFVELHKLMQAERVLSQAAATTDPYEEYLPPTPTMCSSDGESSDAEPTVGH